MKHSSFTKALSLLIALASICATTSAAEFLEHEEQGRKELATYMAELQVLTHKLGLSIEAKNRPLIRFYLHESLVLIEDIQESLPEYEGIPVALYMDRMALPAYQTLRERYDTSQDRPKYFDHISTAYDGLITTCNTCHASSSHDYIRIKRNSFNPYLQDFSARKTSQ
jgi:hypothetical protein|tara:strand:- start:1200 stop:1703 length:504 start_codon:yes stop_codon:yes gene_type:complete